MFCHSLHLVSLWVLPFWKIMVWIVMVRSLAYWRDQWKGLWDDEREVIWHSWVFCMSPAPQGQFWLWSLKGCVSFLLGYRSLGIGGEWSYLISSGKAEKLQLEVEPWKVTFLAMLRLQRHNEELMTRGSVLHKELVLTLCGTWLVKSCHLVSVLREITKLGISGDSCPSLWSLSTHQCPWIIQREREF